MEFNFDINRYFPNEITKIGSRLTPDVFFGDQQEFQECIKRINLILTVLGEKSAQAQGLKNVITSGDRLRDSEHTIYVLTDPKGGSEGQGCVLGMLKIGYKHLYLFDAGGKNHEVTAKCILDFYICESKQRMGLGQRLFQHMLEEENIEPQHLAIDMPNPAILSFLRKHYGLETTIPQANNFVIFDGFFTNEDLGDGPDKRVKTHAAGISSLPSRVSCGGLAESSVTTTTPNNSTTGYSHTHTFESQTSYSQDSTHIGRYTANNPVSTMGMIIQQKPMTEQRTQLGGNGELLHEINQS